MRFTPFGIFGGGQTAIPVDYLIVGGGGAGGPVTATVSGGTGGGGAGGYVSGSTTLTSANSYPIVVGLGGVGYVEGDLWGTPGSGSSALGFSALGGGGGASQAANASPGGGSGGGGASRGAANPVRLPASGSGTQGYEGGVALQIVDGSGGGGGGAAGPGTTATTGNYDGFGPGKLWFNGNTYAEGGPAQGTTAGTKAGVNGLPNTGNGGGGMKDSSLTPIAGGSGGSGIVIIRYQGNQLAYGGTVTSSGSYTYHTFTASGDLIT